MSEPDLVAPQSHGLVAPDQRGAHGSSQNIFTGVPPPLFWANTMLAALGCIAGILALIIVITTTEEYSRRIQTEERMKTQALDEQRMENRYIARALGIEGSDIQSHDLNALMAQRKPK